MTQSSLWARNYNEGDLVEPSGNPDDLWHIINVFSASIRFKINIKSRFRVNTIMKGSMGHNYVYVTLLDEALIPLGHPVGGFYVYRFRKCPCVMTSTRRLTVIRQESEGN